MDQYDRIGLFDMDGSLADYDGALRRGLELLRAPSEPQIPINLWDMEKEEYIRNRMRLIKSQPGFWLGLERIEIGFAILEVAEKMGYKNSILTKGPRLHSAAWAEKLAWCQREIHTDIDVTVTMNKGMVFGTFLYDDFPDYMNKWLEHRPRGLGIMPATATNRGFDQPQVVRWNGYNLDEVEAAMKIAFDREPKQPLVLPWKIK